MNIATDRTIGAISTFFIFIAIFVITMFISTYTLADDDHERRNHRKHGHNDPIIKIVERGTVDLRLPILHVIDGDTIATAITLPAPLDSVSIRIRGIDTPESRLSKCAREGRPCPSTTKAARCFLEMERGKNATSFIKTFIGSTGVMVVKNYKWDKFGKRIDGDIYINGENIGQLLIDKGYATAYNGKGKKPNWCE